MRTVTVDRRACSATTSTSSATRPARCRRTPRPCAHQRRWPASRRGSARRRGSRPARRPGPSAPTPSSATPATTALWGQDGDDTDLGGDGDDDLYGELGEDMLFGDAGEDAILGDRGGIVNQLPRRRRRPRRSRLHGDDQQPRPGESRTPGSAAGGSYDRRVGPAARRRRRRSGSGRCDRAADAARRRHRGRRRPDPRRAGRDSIHAGFGDDLANGDSGGDEVFGGDGADVLWGGKGCDPSLDAATPDCRLAASSTHARGTDDRFVDHVFGGRADDGGIDRRRLGRDLLDFNPRGTYRRAPVHDRRRGRRPRAQEDVTT